MSVQNVTNSSINNSSNNVNSVKPNEPTNKQEIEPKKIDKKKLACTVAAALGVTALAAAIIFKGKSKGKIEEVASTRIPNPQKAFSPEILKLSDEALADVSKAEQEAQGILKEVNEVQQKGQNIIDEMLEKVKASKKEPIKGFPLVEDGKKAYYGAGDELNVFDEKENILYVGGEDGVLSKVNFGYKEDYLGEKPTHSFDRQFAFNNGKLDTYTEGGSRINRVSTASKTYSFIDDSLKVYEENLKWNHDPKSTYFSRGKYVYFDSGGKVRYEKGLESIGGKNTLQHHLFFDSDRKLMRYLGVLEEQSAK